MRGLQFYLVLLLLVFLLAVGIVWILRPARHSGLVEQESSVARRALKRRRLLVLTWLMAGCGTIVAAMWFSGMFPERTTGNSAESQSKLPTESILPPQVLDRGYVSSNACRTCHPKQFESWHASYHRTMTQPATPETVVAPFDDIRLQYRGQTAFLERRGAEFWVEMVDPLWEIQQFDRGINVSYVPDAPRVQNEIVMTTGSHHFQVYWFRSKFGRELWQFPWRYHIAEKRWIHRRHVFLEPPNGVPGMGFRVWNHNCIGCHSVAGVPGMNLLSGNMENTKVAELGIACEACHGPGEEHVRFFQNLSDGDTYSEHEMAIVNPEKCTPRIGSQICGSCHSYFSLFDYERWALEGNTFRPGNDITNFGKFRRHTDEHSEISTRFWSDGTARSGGREYNGMIESKCYKKGELSCFSCHSLHQSDPNDQLAANMRSNEACFGCHESYRDNLRKHTHHASESSGSLCYNCHMAHTSYALYKAIRNHQINSPQVTGIERNGRPTACNLCHLDKTLDWTAGHLSNWWGVPKSKLTDDEQGIAASLLWLLRGDAGQRVITAWSMGWKPAQQASGTDWIAPFLAKTLNDPYSAVRFVGYRSLRTLPGFDDFKYDFDAPPESRAGDYQRVLKIWLSGPAETSSRPRPQLLLETSKKIQSETLQRLTQQRDNRPLQIVE